MSAHVAWPGGRKFAFTIIDDTDHATLARIKPIYQLLADLDILITKTVWVFPAPEDRRWGDAETLDNAAYRDFVLELRDKGFEIALHGVRGTTSTRDVIRRGLDRYASLVGGHPRMHINHAQNADNLYWGEARLPWWRRSLGLHRAGPPASGGHDPASPHFWGDYCASTIDYVRALSFGGIDTLRCDPYMPYHDERYPLVKAWFSCSDAGNIASFRRLLSPDNIRSLAESGGASIVYTHFGGPGFLTEKGDVDPDVRASLVALREQPGWFRPGSEVLDALRGPSLRRLRPLQRLRLESRARWDRTTR